jgi:hypothetical protein
MRYVCFLSFSLFACDTTTNTTPSPDVATDVVAVDAAMDVASDSAPKTPDVDVREGGGSCSFNRDCIATERCECSESSGCRCTVGTRGTGQAGVDACTSGNQCASALCLEGSGGSMVCSEPCMTASECPRALPRCIQVAFVGRICVRDPSATTDGGTALDVTPTAMLTGRFGTRTGGFDRAQHGVSGTNGVYVEAYAGGDLGCPTMTSRTPQRTLVISGIRADVSAVQTEAGGVTASLLDFTGDLVSVPVVRATAVRLTPRSIDRGVSVSFEITATFPGGTITGSFTAGHCTSLDAR